MPLKNKMPKELKPACDEVAKRVQRPDTRQQLWHWVWLWAMNNASIPQALEFMAWLLQEGTDVDVEAVTDTVWVEVEKDD